VIVEGEAHDMRRRRESGVGRVAVAVAPFEAEIAGRLFRQQRRAGGAGRGGGRHGGQRHVLDRDQLRRVLRLVARLGDDERHRLADVAHLVHSQERLRLEGEGLAGDGIGLGAGAQRRESVGGDLGGGQHRQHARRGKRRRPIDAVDPRVRMRRAQHHRMDQPVERQIVEIAAAPGQEAQILPPLRRIADLGSDACRHNPMPLRPNPVRCFKRRPNHGTYICPECPQVVDRFSCQNDLKRHLG
jgi:hypothetical protein